jgi:phosphoglycolate phosphatase-like HAD superfamily hydrolase
VNPPDDVWVFDVDGTLIGSVRSDRLRPGVEELITTLEASNTTLVVWSAGGAEYAERMLGQFGLAHRFRAFYHKETRNAAGRYQVDHMHPEHRPGTLVDDYPGEVTERGRIIGVRQFLGGNPADDGLREALEIARAAARARR